MIFGDPAVTSGEALHKVIFPLAQWLGTSNCCMNPLVYCFFSQKIRRRIRAMLCCDSASLDSYASTRCATSRFYSQVPQSSRYAASRRQPGNGSANRRQLDNGGTNLPKLDSGSANPGKIDTGSPNRRLLESESANRCQQFVPVRTQSNGDSKQRFAPTMVETHHNNGSSGNSYGDHYGGGNLSHHRVMKSSNFSSTHVWSVFIIVLLLLLKQHVLIHMPVLTSNKVQLKQISDIVKYQRRHFCNIYGGKS